MRAVCYQRSGYPDLGAHTSRFKSLSHLLGPWAVECPLLGYNSV
jgi:hypothetical protein